MEKVRGVQLSFLVDTSSFSIQLCTWTQTALSPKKVRALNFESYSTPENFFPVNTGVQCKPNILRTTGRVRTRDGLSGTQEMFGCGRMMASFSAQSLT